MIFEYVDIRKTVGGLYSRVPVSNGHMIRLKEGYLCTRRFQIVLSRTWIFDNMRGHAIFGGYIFEYNL